MSNHFLVSRFLNPIFNFNFDDAQKAFLREEKEFLEDLSPKCFDQVVPEIQRFVPFEEINDIGSFLRNKKCVLEIYAQLKGPNLPSIDAIDERWVIYRRLQVEIMAAYEYRNKFKKNNLEANPKDNGHNQMDRICTLALLTQAIATGDKLMRRYFEAICPEGLMFIPPNQK